MQPRANGRKTMPPILPAPITPSVLRSSFPRPMNFDFSHLPAWVEGDASGFARATGETSSRWACSAVVDHVAERRVPSTITPSCWAAGSLSNVITPIPARPTTLSFRCFHHLFSHFGCPTDRQTINSCPMISSRLFPCLFQAWGWKSTQSIRGSAISARGVGQIPSEMRTLGAMCVVL